MVKFKSTIYPHIYLTLLLHSEAYITESTPYLPYKDRSAYMFEENNHCLLLSSPSFALL
jgi:hypothetical protein